ncbi:MAG: nucleotidyltransferase domain-containing protein [Coriobacteriales bacterium]|nr:nucleotidyltransferase domain-containing protein [Coriobacteriales bacterium]
MKLKDAIDRELSACEAAKGVKVLIAVESGSRCWGFASPDSDYDVRFVYARPKDEYLSLKRVHDTIEWRLDEELDVVGWDVSKFLTLMRGSNPQTFEWISSTIVYRELPCFQEVRDIAPLCFNPVKNAHHYLGMVRKHDSRYLRNGNVNRKRYLYCVRGILACRWAARVRKPVPMAFGELADALLEPEMRPLVDELIEVKRQGHEKERCEPIKPLEDWILAQLDQLEDEIALLKAPKSVEWPVLDRVFIDCLDLC